MNLLTCGMMNHDNNTNSKEEIRASCTENFSNSESEKKGARGRLAAASKPDATTAAVCI